MDQKVSDKISEPQHHPPLNAFTRSGCSVKFRHVTPSLKIIIYGDGREIGWVQERPRCRSLHECEVKVKIVFGGQT